MNGEERCNNEDKTEDRGDRYGEQSNKIPQMRARRDSGVLTVGLAFSIRKAQHSLRQRWGRGKWGTQHPKVNVLK